MLESIKSVYWNIDFMTKYSRNLSGKDSLRRMPFIECLVSDIVGFPGGSVVKNLPANAGLSGSNAGLIPWSGRCPGEEKVTLSGILVWRIPWTEEPYGLQSMGLQRVGHDRETEHMHACQVLGNYLDCCNYCDYVHNYSQGK